MLPQLISLPFSIPNAYEGFAKVHGILSVNEIGLTLEFEVKDGLVGVLKSGVKVVQVPINEIASVDLQRFWLFTRIVIRTKSMAILSQVPQSKAGKVAVWSIGFQNRELAERLVSSLKSKVMERELDYLSQEIHQLEDTGVYHNAS